MNDYQQQKTREKIVDIKQEEGKLLKQGPKESSADKQSPASSPTHEFSFTVVSLHSSSNTVTTGKTKTPSSTAIDLSPADDIFFHGHLLPLRLLPHLPVSPRCSTSYSDGFNFPMKELLDEPRPDNNKPCTSTSCSRISTSDSNIRSENNNNHSQVGNFHHQIQSHNNIETKGRPKSKSFSLSSLTRWHPKGMHGGVRETEEKEKHKTKMRRFDLRHVLKRYVRLVRPLLFFRGRRLNNRPLRRQSYSFSGNLRSRNKEEDFRGRRAGECYSAPASMRTSPTNSCLLVATAGFGSSSDSTMEELQAAIQAAIAHCKNSSQAGEDKFKCQA